MQITCNSLGGGRLKCVVRSAVTKLGYENGVNVLKRVKRIIILN
jgi:hypothetical protein